MRFKLPWQPMRWIFYDCEIIKCIGHQPGFECVDSWGDHANMGISCIATYSNWDNAYRIFQADELQQFQKLVNQSDRVVGFNSLSFDNKLCAANGLKIQTSFDLLSQTWVAAGLPPTYTKGVTIAGYSLEKLALANLGTGKSGSGSLAPVLFQQGKKHSVYMYCMNDVYLSVELLKLGWAGELIDPANGNKLAIAKLT